MKNCLLIIAFIFVGLASVMAQGFGNEWISYNQKYYKILVQEDGIYRLHYSELVQSGFPADQIDPRKIQIFFQGEEQYIYIKGENNSGIFDPNGFIEFYGKRNRAGIDSLVYQKKTDLINPDYSLFNDTSAYFITWNNNLSNRRMQQSNQIDFENYEHNQAEYIWKTNRINYVATFVKGSNRCIYGDGEGWFDSQVFRIKHSSGDAVVSKTISCPQVYTSGPAAKLKTAVVGYASSAAENHFPHHFKLSIAGNVIIDETFSGYENIVGEADLNPAEIGSQLVLRYTANDQTVLSVPDQMRVSWISLKYPHKLNFEALGYFEFELPKGSGGKQLVKFTNFSASNPETVVLYDLTNNKRIKLVKEDEDWKFLIDDNELTRKCVISSPENIKSVSAIRKISTDDKFVNYKDLYPSAKYFIISHPNLWTSANQYADYRRNMGLNIAIADVNQLYDQFAFGIEKHPYSITAFLNYMMQGLDYEDSFLLLFGKSIHSPNTRKSAANFKNCLVPTFGYPSADILFTVPIDGSSFAPKIATGRISAKNNQEALIYLNKIIEYESNPRAEWMKNILHFGGGANSSEQASFANYLNLYKNIIEDTLWGAYVSTFLKTTSAPIQITLSDSVTNLINNGVSLMTFFGHAYSGGFDQNIDKPQVYSNQGKYPLILANSCFAGDIHLATSESTSEEWILADKLGAIGYLASVGDGIPNYLNIYSHNFYRHISALSYSKPIGQQIIKTIEDAQQVGLNNYNLEITCHDFTLHGDPYLKLNSYDLPDLTPKLSDINLLPNNITTAVDSFDVRFVISNIGRATNQEFTVLVKRVFPDDSDVEYLLALNGCNYRDTLKIRLPVEHIKGPGLNKIIIHADYMNEVAESNENNNIASLNFMISSGDIIPIWPNEFAIVPDANISLLASTGNPFAQAAEYILQVDTIDSFNSVAGQALYQNSKISDGGIVSWDLPFNLLDSTVYYWRIAHSHSNPDSINWKEMSFIYISEKEGWSQAHFHQFKKDDYQFIEYNRNVRKFNFVEVSRRLQAYNHKNLSVPTYGDVRFTIDGAFNNGFGDHSCCGPAPAMMLAIIDPIDLLAWPSDKDDYGHRNYPQCPNVGRPDYYFVFSSGAGNTVYEESIQNMYEMIEGIPDGYYVLVYSWSNGYFEQWPENVVSGFESMGAVNIRNLQNSQAYIFFARKGFPSYTKEAYSTTNNYHCSLEADLFTDFHYGNIKSTKIGPASQWNSLHWNQAPMEFPDLDSVRLSVLGIDVLGNEHVLIQNIEPEEYDIYNLNEIIDYQEYPYLKLNFYTRDDTAKTPAQLLKWQIYYEGVPETAISPSDGLYFCCDTLEEGETIKFALATKNISAYDMDSLLVKYWIVDKDNNII
ncbi:MAG: hypothetical protein GX879_00435, partial [Bacteroidales bacterium]|nr:hypothetical protein [Bacteroidales bacterium]